MSDSFLSSALPSTAFRGVAPLKNVLRIHVGHSPQSHLTSGGINRCRGFVLPA